MRPRSPPRRPRSISDCSLTSFSVFVRQEVCAENENPPRPHRRSPKGKEKALLVIISETVLKSSFLLN